MSVTHTIASVVVVLAFALPGPVPAEESAPLRLADVISRAKGENPEIRGARERARAAAFAPARASAYDDPTFAYEAWNAPESFDVTRADNGIFKLSQKLPFPGKRTLAGAVAAEDAEVARREADAVELEVVASVKRAYYDLWLAHQNLLVYARDRDLVERFARIAEGRYAVGAVSQPDVLRAQMELTRLANRITTETLAAERARAELNALLSRGPGESLGVPEDPPSPKLGQTAERWVALALERRPEISAQGAAIARDEKSVRAARLDYLPDFELQASRFVNYRSRDGWGAMAMVSIPFVQRGKYDAALGEAEARLASTQADHRKLEDLVRREVTQAFLRARSALLQYELLTTTHIPLAEQALASSEVSYQTGKIDFLSLIDSVRAIESVHLEHFLSEKEFEHALADLERAVGGKLEREGDERGK